MSGDKTNVFGCGHGEEWSYDDRVAHFKKCPFHPSQMVGEGLTCQLCAACAPPTNQPPWVDREKDERPQKGGWAPGNYINKCACCKKNFQGDKRAHICAVCAYDELHKEEMAQPDGQIKLDPDKHCLSCGKDYMIGAHRMCIYCFDNMVAKMKELSPEQIVGKISDLNYVIRKEQKELAEAKALLREVDAAWQSETVLLDRTEWAVRMRAAMEKIANNLQPESDNDIK